MVQSLWKTLWSFLKKLKIELPYDPAISLLGIHISKINVIRILKRYLYFHVHCSIIHSSQHGNMFQLMDEGMKKM